MYSHIQTDAQGAFLKFIKAGENIEWDANNYCTAFALEKDGKAEQFGVQPFFTTAQPSHDPITQAAVEANPVLIDGLWTQQWSVVDLSPEQIEAARKARVPTVLTIRQAKLVLHAAGLLDDVDAAVAAADRATQIDWEYATEIHRDWPTLVAMATALGMTDAQLDDLFIEGAKL